MKRKWLCVILGLTALLVAYMLLLYVSPDRFFARGSIRLQLKTGVQPAEGLAYFDLSGRQEQWYGRQLGVISNLLNAPTWNSSVKTYQRKNDNIRFCGAQIGLESGVGSMGDARAVEINFSGSDADAIWRVTSNACRALAGFFATNRLAEFPATNLMTCEAEHIDTSFWKPTPLWKKLLNEAEDFFAR